MDCIVSSCDWVSGLDDLPTGFQLGTRISVLYHTTSYIMDNEEDMMNAGGDPVAGPSHTQEEGGDAPLSKKAIKRAARQVSQLLYPVRC